MAIWSSRVDVLFIERYHSSRFIILLCKIDTVNWQACRKLYLELLAARRAVSFTAESGFDQFKCEGDSEFVVNSLRRTGMENSRGGHLIQDITYLSNSFRSISFAHVRRQGNVVAHALAQ